MFFNGNFTFFSIFINFLCYSMGIMQFFTFFVNFLCYSMRSLYFVNFPYYSMGIWGLRRLGRGGTDGQKNRCMEIHLCVLQEIGPLGPLPKKEWRCNTEDMAPWGRCGGARWHRKKAGASRLVLDEFAQQRPKSSAREMGNWSRISTD